MPFWSYFLHRLLLGQLPIRLVLRLPRVTGERCPVNCVVCYLSLLFACQSLRLCICIDFTCMVCAFFHFFLVCVFVCACVGWFNLCGTSCAQNTCTQMQLMDLKIWGRLEKFPSYTWSSQCTSNSPRGLITQTCASCAHWEQGYYWCQNPAGYKTCEKVIFS